MSETLNWALIGASDIAATRMIPAIRRSGDDLRVVVSGDATHARDYAAANEIQLASADINDAITDDIDAVYISNRNPLHFESALASINAGKHVLCEKPVALTVAEARQLVIAAESAGVVFAVNHHLPGSPLHAAVRRLVSEGRIGTIHSARIHHAVALPERLRGWRVADEPGSGVVLDITCHDASVLNPLLGIPLRTTAIGVSQADWNHSGAIDAVMTVIEYEGPNGEKIIAQTHDAFTVGFDQTSLEVQGSAGSIRVLDAMTQDTPGEVTLVDDSGEHQVPVDTTADLYSIILDAFHGAIAGTGAPTASGGDGLLAVAVALAVEESIRTATTVSVN